MPLKKIPLPPGFDKNDTASQAEGMHTWSTEQRSFLTGKPQ